MKCSKQMVLALALIARAALTPGAALGLSEPPAQKLGGVARQESFGEVESKGPTVEGKTGSQWLTNLRNGTFSERLAAARALQRFGPAGRPAVPALIEALKDWHELVRVHAATALGKIGSEAKDAVPGLIAVLKDRNVVLDDLRPAAAEALGLIGASDKDAIRALLEVVKERNPALTLKAGVALDRIGPNAKEAIPAPTLAHLDGEARTAAGAVPGKMTPASEQLLRGSFTFVVPSSVTIVRGESASIRVRVRRNESKGPIKLTFVGQPNDGQEPRPLQFAETTITADKESAEVTLTASQLTTPGNWTVWISASGADHWQFARTNLRIIEPGLKLLLPRVVALDLSGKSTISGRVERQGFDGPVKVNIERIPGFAHGTEAAIPAGKTEFQLEVVNLGKTEVMAREVRIGGTADLAKYGRVGSLSSLVISFRRQPPLAEKYLHSGDLVGGVQALQTALAKAPKDDQIRFGLGVLQFVRGVERLGQSLYKYGVRSENTSAIPFLRLPVPPNPNPTPIRYADFRRMFDDLVRDLAGAESTLAGVTAEDVKLPLRLAGIRLDLDGDGKADDHLMDILNTIMLQRRPDFLETNPDFYVCFDRGDVAWLRAYCHLLMGMLDFYLAIDTQPLFNLWADEWFGRQAPRSEENNNWAKLSKTSELLPTLAASEPVRLGRFRKHWLSVVKLNRETWKFIRAEKDDDHEWLPNPNQKGVLGLPVRDEMIDAWLALMSELEALLDGKRSLPLFGIGPIGKGLDLKDLLDDPPEDLRLFDSAYLKQLPEKYFCAAKEVDFAMLQRFFGLFQNTTAFAYAMWFN